MKNFNCYEYGKREGARLLWKGAGCSERGQVTLEGARLLWKGPGFSGRGQVSLEGAMLHQKGSGCPLLFLA